MTLCLRITLTLLFWTVCFVFLKSALSSPHGFVFLWEIVLASNTSEIVHCSPVLAIVSLSFKALSFLYNNY